jgi:putative membrane protein
MRATVRAGKVMGGRNMADRGARFEWALVAIVLVALAVSGISPHDRLTWWMEVAPVLMALPLLMATHRRYPLTRLVLALIAVHALILILGATYTYARVPLGFWLQDVFDFARNPYDRIGHFAQGFVPAMVARELLLRLQVLRRPRWLFFLVCCICLAISATYELIEWLAAVVMGGEAEDFLGTQGDPWDTQSDMALALLGAVFAQMLLGRWHDRWLARLR